MNGCDFYAAVLRVLQGSGVPFLVGGSHAIGAYIGRPPNSKDLDVFCVAGDYPKLIRAGVEAGYEAEVEDERWIAKLRQGDCFCDVIWGSANLVTPVSEAWFTDEHTGDICGVSARLIPPTETIWSKAFIMDRNRFDGNMIAHLILKQHQHIDWKRLLGYMEPHWEVLMFHVLRFRYIYPSEREIIPGWFIDELLSRLANQRTMPRPQRRACRGRLFSRDDFDIDVKQWGFADAVGDHSEP